MLALLASAHPAFAQTDAASSAADRQRFVGIVRSLERTPLDPALQADRQWALQWATDAPDVSVDVCMDPLGGASQKDYAHFPQIVFQYTIAMAAFVIENPAKANDADAQQLAGVESALKAYRSIHAAQPDVTSPALEKLLGMQGRGELAGFVQKAYPPLHGEGRSVRSPSPAASFRRVAPIGRRVGNRLASREPQRKPMKPLPESAASARRSG
ncbi:hypothetical protein U1839_01780 [Sphingomonas sp. RT2P30]|uniref:hypothetical protein n=1 Tax=Parasphingomonas halimpatiens TaxID=3096162 RepID=UPI002FCA157E